MQCKFLLLFALTSIQWTPCVAMEPLAILASQPTWQASKPVELNIDYDGEHSTHAQYKNMPSFCLSACFRTIG